MKQVLIYSDINNHSSEMMQLLKEIASENIDKNLDYKLRRAARTILFNQEEKVALLYVSKHDYHKIPGGAIKTDEDKLYSLRREVQEEIGVKELDIQDELGIIIEYRDGYDRYETGLIQVSYCYISYVNGEIGRPNFTKKEKELGLEVKWFSLEDAIEILENDVSNIDYVNDFIIKRDLCFLKHALDSN